MATANTPQDGSILTYGGYRTCMVSASHRGSVRYVDSNINIRCQKTLKIGPEPPMSNMANSPSKELITERTTNPNPRLEKVEFVSKAVHGNEFYLHIIGENLNPETVRLKVTGPGSGGDDPCIVPNGALRVYGDVTEFKIDKAPLTLARGKYQIWLENDSAILLTN